MTPLTIELVPKTAWFKNLRSELPKEQWDKLRKECYRKANYVCECCGGKGNKWPVECHEIWAYDDKKKKQTLLGLIALCPSCHEVKHIGFASVRGRLDAATQHLANVNRWSFRKSKEYIDEAFKLWEKRSAYEWELDITWAAGDEHS